MFLCGDQWLSMVTIKENKSNKMNKINIPSNESSDSVKTILHFSDGVLEIVENEDVQPTASEIHQEPSVLDWGPWVWHYTSKFGTKSLEVCDYAGEKLASFLGITTPKYQFEINEYNRIMQEKEIEDRERDLEVGTWVKDASKEITVSKPPQGMDTPELPRF